MKNGSPGVRELTAEVGVMGSPEVDAAGSVGDVEEMGDEYGFTLYDSAENEIAAFAFHNEREARIAHKMMEAVVTMALAVSPAA
jgi:hypothetical protein